MDTVIKAFAGLFFTLLIVFVGTGLIASSINSGKAERFANDSAVRIGNSNYSPEVVNICKNEAKKQGYDMEVMLVESNGRTEYGTLILTYPYRIPIIGIQEDHSVETDIL